MPNYKVAWEIDIVADTAEEAAQLARIEQLKEATSEIPTFFRVVPRDFVEHVHDEPSLRGVVDSELPELTPA